MTKEDNLLIADFMGIHVRYQGPILYHCAEDGYIDFVDGADTYSPHANWSDLMPVVEKIEADSTNDVVIYKEATQIRVWSGEAEGFFWKVLEPDGASKIAHTYRAVVKYIKWYNQQNLKRINEL